jgi:O-antigen/teichoic acid export membrane protein
MAKTASEGEYFNTAAVRQNLKQRAVQGGATTAISQAVKFGLTIGSTAVLARLLTPQDYGLIAMVTVITGFIANFYYLGLSKATIQHEEIDHDQVSTLFWVNVAASTGMALLVAMLAPVLSWFYGEPRLTWITVTLAAAFVLMGLGVQHQALLNRQMRFGALAASDVIATLGGIVVGIACASAGLAYRSLVAAQLTTAALSSALLWWFCGWRPRAAGSLSRVYPMLRFGGAITGFQVVNYFARNGDNFLIGRFHGSQELGLYSRAYNLLLFPLIQILSPISSVALPTLSRMNGEAFRAAFLRMARVACVLSMPLVAFTIGTADLIIEIFLGAQWHEASNIFAWLGFVGLVQPIANASGWVFVAQGRAKEQLLAGIINGTISVLSFLVGLPWGGTGVAAAYAVSGVVIRTPLLFWLAGRNGAVRTRDFYAVLTPFLVASVTALALTVALRTTVPLTTISGLAAGAAVTAVAYLLVLLALSQGRQGLRDVIEVIRTTQKLEPDVRASHPHPARP